MAVFCFWESCIGSIRAAFCHRLQFRRRGIRRVSYDVCIYVYYDMGTEVQVPLGNAG